VHVAWPAGDFFLVGYFVRRVCLCPRWRIPFVPVGMAWSALDGQSGGEIALLSVTDWLLILQVQKTIAALFEPQPQPPLPIS
jgi:hypothetical protein